MNFSTTKEFEAWLKVNFPSFTVAQTDKVRRAILYLLSITEDKIANINTDKAPLENPEFTGEIKLNGEVVLPVKDGVNYLMVYGIGTPSENAAELQAAYDEAKKMPRFIGFLAPPTPTYMYAGQTFGVYMGGSPTYYKILVDGEYVPYQMSGSVSVIVTESEAKSVRTTVIVAPGEYNFGASAFEVNAESINIVSLTGNSDVIISSTEKNNDYNITYGIKVITSNILIKGINCKTNTFYVESSLNNLICEYCIGGNNSFGYNISLLSGTFNYCTGGDGSFGTQATIIGTFNYCIGGNYSFGAISGESSGTFNNCIGGNNSFGGAGTIASGIFNNCVGGDGSFGTGGTASGTFTNCKGGASSFGTYAGNASGTFINCTGGDYSFGSYGGTISGTFNNCVGGTDSFGTYGGTIEESARLYYTHITSGTFPTPNTGGRLILCIDGDNNIVTI